MKVLMLGTAAKGGMIAVVRSYLDSETLSKYGIRFIPTHVEQQPMVKSAYFLFSLMRSVPCLVDADCRIVHLHFTKHGSVLRKGLFILLAKIFSKKTILHLHGADFFEAYRKYPPPVKRLVVGIFGRADRVIVLSEKRKAEYSRLISSWKMAVVPNSVDLPPERREEPGRAGVRIITLGRLGERKGTGDLISALQRLGDRPFFADLAGDGDLERYRRLISERRLDSRVKIRGWVTREAKRRLLETADIFVLPSYQEDLPVAILEAMAYSLPVVSTRVAGIPELVRDGESGFLVSPGDVDGLADRLARLIDSPPLRAAMGRAGRRIAEVRFDRRTIEAKIAALYESLVHA